MKKVYIYISALILILGVSIGLFFYFNTSSVEKGVLSELDLDSVEKIAVVESNNPTGILNDIEELERQAIIDELKHMEVRRVNLFSATRPTDLKYVIFLETSLGEIYQVHLYESENLISFTSPNIDVNSSRSYRYSKSQLHNTVTRFFET